MSDSTTAEGGDLATLKQRFETLQTQFEAASSKWPDIHHSLFVLAPTEMAQLPPELTVLRDTSASAQPTLGLCDGRLQPKLGPPVAHFVEHLWSNRPSDGADNSASVRFEELATAAGRLILELPEDVLQLVRPSDNPHPDAGIAEELWVTRFIRRVDRVKAQHVYDQCAAAGHDISRHRVPDRDRYWIDPVQSDSEMWGILLHNLAWRTDTTDILQAERKTWQGKLTYILGAPEDWRMDLSWTLDRKGGLAVPLPLKWMRSELQADAFLSSVQAIDRLLAAMAPPATTPTETIDAKGFVTKPCEESAYVSATDILNDHTPVHWSLSYRKFNSLVVSRRSIRKWRPRRNRLSIHLNDWRTFVGSNPNGPPSRTDDTWCDDEEEIATRKAVIRDNAKQ